MAESRAPVIWVDTKGLENDCMDKIIIEDLEIFAHHGVFPEENEKGQLFYVRAVLYTNTRLAGQKDDLDCSVDYGEACHFITTYMKEHTFKLIEAVAENMARQLLGRYPLVRSLELEIRKPQAPIGLPFGCVSVRISRGWHRVYLSVGSNMGDRLHFLEDGIRALKENPQIRVRKVSDLLPTEPYGGVEQEDFLNGAVELDTLYTPQELLEQLHIIEAAAGRERLVHWGPRTLDLDILMYDKLVWEDDDLIIPHVDMHNRLFVLEPMTQIAPNLRHPVLGKTMAELRGLL